MQLYAITDRRMLAGTEPERQRALSDLVRDWANSGIDYIQVREKDLAPDELRSLTEQIVTAVRNASRSTRVLLNGPVQIALETGADGVHLPAYAAAPSADEARNLFARSGRETILSYSCHSRDEVLKVKEEAQQNPHATTASTLILYAPVFEKQLSTEDRAVSLLGIGLVALAHIAEAAKPIPVFALGGVTKQNAPACIDAGAAGIAGIRLFLNDGWRELEATRA